MADGKHCPACSQDIGIWPVFSAGLPNWIRCPHCKARLCYRGSLAVSVALLPAVAAVMTIAYLVATSVPLSSFAQWAALFAAVAMGLWSLVELVVVWFLRGNRELFRPDKPGPGWDENLS